MKTKLEVVAAAVVVEVEIDSSHSDSGDSARIMKFELALDFPMYLRHVDVRSSMHFYACRTWSVQIVCQ